MIGVLTLIAGIAVPIWLHRRSHPARQFRYRVVTSRALQGLSGWGATNEPLTIHVGGELVRDPHTFIIEFWSTGRADVPSTAFDAGNALVIDMGARILPGTFRNEATTSQAVQFEQTSETEISLTPRLLSKTLRLSLAGSTVSAPRISIRNPLIDVDVLPEEDNLARPSAHLPFAAEPAVSPPAAPPAAYAPEAAPTAYPPVVASASSPSAAAPAASPPAIALPPSRRRPRVTALLITNGIAVASVVLFIVAVVMLAGDPTRSSTSPGAATGGISLLVFGACVVSYVVIGVVRVAHLIRIALSRRG